MNSIGVRDTVFIVLGLMIYGCGSPKSSNEKGGSAAQRGISDTEIVIGSWGPLTGPAALWGGVSRGVDAYFKMINDEGGIHGRKIRFIYKDDGYQPPRTVAAVREMVESDEVFAFVGTVGTAPGMAVKEYIIENDVLWVSPATGATHWAFPPTKSIFATFPLYFDEVAIIIDYAVNVLEKKKIGIIYQNDDFGKSALIGAQLTLENYDLELAEAVSTEITDSDLGSHAARLQDAGAEVVILWILPRQGAIITGAASLLGFSPQWMSSSVLADMEMMYEITEGRWKNIVYCAYFDPYDTEVPANRKYSDALAKYHPDLRWGGFGSAGFYYAEPLVEALRRAGPDLTQDKVVEALESLDNYQGIGVPVSFGPNQRQGTRSAALFKCIGPKEREKLTSYRKSDINVEEAMKRLGVE